MLRASRPKTNLSVVTSLGEDADLESSGVAHGGVLLRFADAIVGSDDAALRAARQAALGELDASQVVDAAAVASNFQRMVRIADSTGIPLDSALDFISLDVREELDLAGFGGAASTAEAGALKKALSAALAPLLRGALGVASKLMR